MLNITKGRISRAQKVVIYGSEGIGKSSLAAKFPDPLIIDTEGGTAHMDVRRIDKPQSWEEMLAIVAEVAATKGICKTLVIDTADWAEQLAVGYLCEKYKQNSIESFGYGKGYTYLAEEFAKLLKGLDSCISAGIHIVITAHAKMRKFEQPDEMGAYDRWEMKLSKQVSPLVKEWCDLLLFANYQTFVVASENKTNKAQGGKRVIYTSHHPAWDAKTRVALPPVIDLDYKEIAHIFETAKGEPPAKAEEKSAAPIAAAEPPTAPAVAETPAAKVRKMLAEAGITEDELVACLGERDERFKNCPIEQYTAKLVDGWLTKYWPQITSTIINRRKANR